jgi:hypothetical protein
MKANKSEVENNNTKPGFCRRGGSWTADKSGLTKNKKKPETKKTETKKTEPKENGGK